MAILAAGALLLLVQTTEVQERPRLRDAGIEIGTLPVGQHNAITDVPGVLVGQTTLVAGDDVRTGVTVIRPHGGNLFTEKVPAAVVVQNGYGKLIGVTQIRELGEIESPIALTGTLNVFRVADALVTWMLAQDGNQNLRSINVVVGETNDGYLSDIRSRPVGEPHVTSALESASGGAVREGCVGAGTGTVCFGYKGGIGTASRKAAGFTVGVLVQTNFGGRLTVAGTPVWQGLSPARRTDRGRDPKDDRDGSCMMIVATDAPLGARNLERLARRALAGMARTGASFSNGSGDYVIAFSTAEGCRIRAGQRRAVAVPRLPNGQMSPLFTAVAEATEEAILNALFRATTTTGQGRTVEALPIDDVVEMVKRRGRERAP